MKLKQPANERNKEFFILVQTLFNQDNPVVDSNLLNYYEANLLDDENKCNIFRSKVGRMNHEYQSCLLDVIDDSQNLLVGCCGIIKVNRLEKEAQLVLIFYHQYFDLIVEAAKFILKVIRNSRYNLKYLVCNASGNLLSGEAVSMLLELGFTDVSHEKKEARDDPDCCFLRYDASKALPVTAGTFCVFIIIPIY